MSDVKQPEAPKDVELKDLTKDKLEDQIKLAENTIAESRDRIKELENMIQQQAGIAGFAKHLLDKYKIADAPKPDPKKTTPLEVK